MFNLRDLGGHRTADGATVKRGRLYRAAGLHRLTEADVAAASELGLQTVFDLRTDHELLRYGAFPTELVVVEPHHAPMLPDLRERSNDAVAAGELLGGRYVGMLESGRDAVALVVNRLAEPDAFPAAFYCTAGKDRTGVMAAVLLGLLGVSDDEIAADYLLTAEAMPHLREWIEANEPDMGRWMKTLPPAVLDTPVEAVHFLLDGLRERHGSIEAYVRWCGADEGVIDALRTGLTERAAA
jgi:protein tyrosine/serine phosphatase